MSESTFIHLKVHSAYSLAEGAITIPHLTELCLRNAMPALALTDTSNMFGALEFAVTCAQRGIQPIMGCLLPLKAHEPTTATGSSFGRSSSRPERPYQLPVLCQNEEGYHNLIRLITEAYLDVPDAESPSLTWQQLHESCQGLIALTGAQHGPINRLVAQGNHHAAASLLQQLQVMFGDRLYIELSRLGLPDEETVEPWLFEQAMAHNIPLVATNEVFFEDRQTFEAHDALLCISESTFVGVESRRRVTPEHYFKSPAEMAALFADVPEALANTVVIAKRCAAMPRPGKPILPEFPCPDGINEHEQLHNAAFSGLESRLTTEVFPRQDAESDLESLRHIYTERLTYEINIIRKMGFAGYFLIVADFIQWAKQQGIPVGPGRGSGAGSLVAWALTITDIDPIRFGLIFERFLNPERVSMPDFDIDFCQERRDEVINYVRGKYGDDRVAHIITFGKLQARAVLRDVGRVLQMPYAQVDRICKLVPNNPANPVSLKQALDIEPQIRQQAREDAAVAKLITIAQQLEGLYRHASTHAAGVVIGDRPLSALIPLYRDPRSPMPVTQFSMKYVEMLGLLKFDFLGLKTLTVIDHAINLIRARHQEQHNLTASAIPLDDRKTFDLLNRGETVGIFQLESAGMRDVLIKLKPDRFEELIALVALYRPGPMDDIPRYLACKHGQEPVHYAHPLLEPILKDSFGVMVVQEQVMQIAQVLAGYSLGAADLLRRAMGKKNRKEMDEQRQRFVSGAVERGVESQTASLIFDQISKFAGYGFNKSHAAPYALLTYQTAYLKANFPHEFLCALMCLDHQNVDKLNIYRQDLQRYGIDLLPPDVNASGDLFTLVTQSDGRVSVRYGLAAIKNVGQQAMQSMVQERFKNGSFINVQDFIRRCGQKSVNKRQLESLAQSGAFDSLHPCRRGVFEALEPMIQIAKESGNQTHAGSLFGDDALAPHRPAYAMLTNEWDPLERLQREFDSIGFYLSAHPLDSYPLAEMGLISANALAETASDYPKMAGIVLSVKERVSKNGQRFAFAQLSDPSGQFEIALFSEVLQKARDYLQPGMPVLVKSTRRRVGDEIKLTAQSIEKLDACAAGGVIDIKLANQDALHSLVEILAKAPPGSGRIRVHIPTTSEAGMAILSSRSEKMMIELPGGYELSLSLRASLQQI